MAVANKIAAENRITSTGKLYVYHFTRVPHYLEFLPGRCKKDFVCHAFDIPYFWRPWFVPMSKESKAMARNYVKYFIGFVQGDVNLYANSKKKDKKDKEKQIRPMAHNYAKQLGGFVQGDMNLHAGSKKKEKEIWPIYDDKTKSVMVFDEGYKIQSGVRENECSLWNNDLHYKF